MSYDFWTDTLLPVALGAGSTLLTGTPYAGMAASGLINGVVEKKGLMGAATGALGAYGGGSLASSLGSLGASTASDAAVNAAVEGSAGNAASFEAAGADVAAQDAARAAGQSAAEEASKKAAEDTIANRATNMQAGLESFSGPKDVGSFLWDNKLATAGLLAPPAMAMMSPSQSAYTPPGKGTPVSASISGPHNAPLNQSAFNSPVDLQGREQAYFTSPYTNTMANGGPVQHYDNGGAINNLFDAMNPDTQKFLYEHRGEGSIPQWQGAPPQGYSAPAGMTAPPEVTQTQQDPIDQAGLRIKMAAGGHVPSQAGRLLKGPGTGTSDSIPATIDGKMIDGQHYAKGGNVNVDSRFPAAVSTGEFVTPQKATANIGANNMQLLSEIGKALDAQKDKKKKDRAVKAGLATIQKQALGTVPVKV